MRIFLFTQRFPKRYKKEMANKTKTTITPIALFTSILLKTARSLSNS